PTPRWHRPKRRSRRSARRSSASSRTSRPGSRRSSRASPTSTPSACGYSRRRDRSLSQRRRDKLTFAVLRERLSVSFRQPGGSSSTGHGHPNRPNGPYHVRKGLHYLIEGTGCPGGQSRDLVSAVDRVACGETLTAGDGCGEATCGLTVVPTAATNLDAALD